MGRVDEVDNLLAAAEEDCPAEGRSIEVQSLGRGLESAHHTKFANQTEHNYLKDVEQHAGRHGPEVISVEPQVASSHR
jgi:hypothetical protein